MERVKKFDESARHCNQRSRQGGAVTVLSKHRYRVMIYEHLSNQNTYQKLDKNLDPTIMKKLKKLLNKHKSIFTVKEFKYLNELIIAQAVFTGSLRYTSPNL